MPQQSPVTDVPQRGAESAIPTRRMARDRARLGRGFAKSGFLAVALPLEELAKNRNSD